MMADSALAPCFRETLKGGSNPFSERELRSGLNLGFRLAMDHEIVVGNVSTLGCFANGLEMSWVGEFVA